MRFAPRLPKNPIRRLYESEASGTLDEELREDIGTRFAMHSENMLAVEEARAGNVRCPRFGRAAKETVIRRGTAGGTEEPLECPECGWKTTWGAYWRRFTRRQLNIGAAESVFRDFLARWKQAKTAGEKMIAVDQVIHEFHVYLMRSRATGERKPVPTRTVAVNLIDGKLTDVIAFLFNPGGRQPEPSRIAGPAYPYHSSSSTLGVGGGDETLIRSGRNADSIFQQSEEQLST